MKLRWKIVLGLVAVVAAMQLVRPPHTNPPVTGEIQAPPEVAAILRRACYDCHSNETKYPWYNNYAPVSWLLWRDVTEGREKLNFSEWKSLPEKRRVWSQRAAWRQVQKGDMPPWFYLPMHKNARLTDEDKKALEWWSTQPPAP